MAAAGVYRTKRNTKIRNATRLAALRTHQKLLSALTTSRAVPAMRMEHDVASAECAWVLWASGWDSKTKAAMPYRPVDGFPTRESLCQDPHQLGDDLREGLRIAVWERHPRVPSGESAAARPDLPPRHRGPARAEGEVVETIASVLDAFYFEHRLCGDRGAPTSWNVR